MNIPTTQQNMRYIQKPLNSGFHWNSTVSDVTQGIDLTGKTAIVTGGYSGLGTVTVATLAALGAKVIIPARQMDIAKAALADIAGDISIHPMDLADLNSVTAFAENFCEHHNRLDLLINNAGIMACPQNTVGDNWEMQFGVNHIGHFVLTHALEHILKSTENARIIALSSAGHTISDIHWDDIHFQNRPYDKWIAYGQSKTANALFALGLDMRWKADGVRAFSVHPGGIVTPLQRHLAREEMQKLGWLDENFNLAKGFKTLEQGAATTLWCATSAMLSELGGLYCENCDVAQLADENSSRHHHVRDWAVNPQSADRLWQRTEVMVKG